MDQPIRTGRCAGEGNLKASIVIMASPLGLITGGLSVDRHGLRERHKLIVFFSTIDECQYGESGVPIQSRQWKMPRVGPVIDCDAPGNLKGPEL